MPNRGAVLVAAVLVVVVVMAAAVVTLMSPSRQVDVWAAVVTGRLPTTVAPPGAGPLSQQDGRQQEYGHDTLEHGTLFSTTFRFEFNRNTGQVNPAQLSELAMSPLRCSGF
jgi:hypothetical protein